MGAYSVHDMQTYKSYLKKIKHTTFKLIHLFWFYLFKHYYKLTEM